MLRNVCRGLGGTSMEAELKVLTRQGVARSTGTVSMMQSLRVIDKAQAESEAEPRPKHPKHSSVETEAEPRPKRPRSSRESPFTLGLLRQRFVPECLECAAEVQRAITLLSDCMPPGYQEKLSNPAENKKWIKDHIFGNKQHKFINIRKDHLLTRKDILEKGAQDLGGRATRSEAIFQRIEQIQPRLEQARMIWKGAHDYLGTVAILNCILNRPSEENMTAAELAKHVERAKTLVDKKNMEVPAVLLELLDKVRVPDPQAH